MLTATKKIWKYQAEKAAWYFVSFTKEEIETGLDIQKKPSGWGQISVRVMIGETEWQTALFPSRARGYDLPIKAAVRRSEHLSEGNSTRIRVATL